MHARRGSTVVGEFRFALEAHQTLSLVLWESSLAKEESCCDDLRVGAKTNAPGFTARYGWYGIIVGVDFSMARAYRHHSGVSEKKCFKDNTYMSVGDADPRTWCTELRSLSSKGGDENEDARDPEFQDFDAERLNSSARGLTGLISAADAATSRGISGRISRTVMDPRSRRRRTCTSVPMISIEVGAGAMTKSLA